MGKKTGNSDYNDYLDGEKLRDNAQVRTSLQSSTSATREISPPPAARQGGISSKKRGKGNAKRPNLTHFLCLPLSTDASRPHLQSGLKKLRDQLSGEGSVPVQAIRPVGTLHLTLGVMSLDDARLEDAKQFLQNVNLHTLLRDISLQNLAESAAENGTIAENLCAAALPDTDALTINLESLVPMQAPQKSSILYAEPKDTSQRLMPFALALRSLFTQEGFLIEDTRPLKLHATILNTIYARPKGVRGGKPSGRPKAEVAHAEISNLPHDHASTGANEDHDDASTAGSADEQKDTFQNATVKSRANGHGPNAKSWMRFDARPLIDEYKNFSWAEGVRVDRVQICRMGAKKIWSGGTEGQGDVVDERYEVVAEKGIFE